jgi:replicative superfamily II helicase
VKDREGRLFDEAVEQRNWPALIFVSSPDRANQLGVKLADHGPAIGDGGEFARWIDENFGSGWELAHTIRHGIGLHHGRVPRAVASHLVRLFNSGELPVLICPSTLIEGINTAAKSVLIYDKAINREYFDFFTFSNLRGRAGRLGQHHVGAVYRFNDVPAHDTFEVQAPLFEDFDKAPDDLVVHISDDERTPAITDRLRDLGRALDLNPDELRLASSSA